MAEDGAAQHPSTAPRLRRSRDRPCDVATSFGVAPAAVRQTSGGFHFSNTAMPECVHSRAMKWACAGEHDQFLEMRMPTDRLIQAGACGQWPANPDRISSDKCVFLNRAGFLIVCAIVLTGAAFPAAAQGSPGAAARFVKAIQHADYAGDRAALKRLYQQAAPSVHDEFEASRLLYWRGFALWRRALNGFNERADPREIEADLTQAVADFRESAARDRGFADAQGGEASCLANLAFLKRNDRTRSGELLLESVALLNKALAIAPGNPRLLWIQGANQWHGSPEHGGGQLVALKTYEKGIEIARQQKSHGRNPLDPAWGEPELLMNLAFANLNRTVPDVASAERYARKALHLVPYWHYVRDILMPQMREKKKQSGG